MGLTVGPPCGPAATRPGGPDLPRRMVPRRRGNRDGARLTPVTALGYTLVGLLLGTGLILAGGVVGGLWFAVSSARPELLEKRPRDDG